MAINVVSNTGPLMDFSKLNILHLLKELYVRVEFPLSVYREAVIIGIRRGFTDAQILNSFFIQNEWRPAKDIEISVDLETANLDRGEKEAISLALSKNACFSWMKSEVVVLLGKRIYWYAAHWVF